MQSYVRSLRTPLKIDMQAVMSKYKYSASGSLLQSLHAQPVLTRHNIPTTPSNNDVSKAQSTNTRTAQRHVRVQLCPAGLQQLFTSAIYGGQLRNCSSEKWLTTGNSASSCSSVFSLVTTDIVSSLLNVSTAGSVNYYCGQI